MGSQFNESGTKTLVAAAATSKYLRTYVDSNGKWAIAGLGVRCDGISLDNAASAEDLTCKLFDAPGTVLVVAAAACTVGNVLYGAASGKVSETASGAPQFLCMEAATADGDIIEALPLSSATAGFVPINPTIEAHTAGDTLLAAESGSIHTNAGASGAITFALPAATVGLNFTFHVQAAQELRVDANGTETLALPSTGVQGAAGKYMSADAVGEWVKYICIVAGTWNVEGYGGTWTAEA